MDMTTPSSNARTGGAGGTRTRDLSQGSGTESRSYAADTPTSTFSGPMWQRHQRILRLQRDHHGELNEQGVRLLGRLARATFDDFADVRREGLAGLW